MQYIQGLKDYKNDRRAVVTFGKFDGLHRGHRELVEAAKALGEKEDVDSVVCAFDMNPQEVLMTKEERKLHLENDVDYLIDCPFTEELREMEAETFIEEVIRDVFHAAFVIVGTDFCFGYGKSGDIHMLGAYAEKCGYELFVIEKKRYKDRIISSTYIRESLKKGEISDANRMLGYGYGAAGIVEHGKKLGRTLGFPTFNVAWPDKKFLPPRGVYFCRVYVDGRGYDGIANIGVKPTVSEEKKVQIESYLFGYEGDAYGSEVMVELLEYVRPERKFSGKEELKVRVASDISCGKKYFGIKE